MCEQGSVRTAVQERNSWGLGNSNFNVNSQHWTTLIFSDFVA